jgi:hypothetical protein
VPCLGYRDVDSLRIHDQSGVVVRKGNQAVCTPSPRPFQVSITVRARDSFYLCYISNPLARCWKFLQQYHQPGNGCSPHLELAIDALSLAYFWHEVNSEAALLAAIQSYVVALGKARAAITRFDQHISWDAVLVALILDIVDKILSTSAHPPSAHVDGGIGLVKMIGFHNSQTTTGSSILLMLMNQAMIGALASQQLIDSEVACWRITMEQNMQSQSYPTGITALFVRYADLQHRFATQKILGDAYAWECYILDAEMAVLELKMPAFWQHHLAELDSASQPHFGDHCHLYAHRNICQSRNLQRVCRLLLNEAVARYASSETVDYNWTCLGDMADRNIHELATEICMSVAQFADCKTFEKYAHMGASDIRCGRRADCSHSSIQIGDCYTLIFPLYAAARSNVSKDIRRQMISYLEHIADHFGIRNAKMVAEILEGGQRPSVWDMYAKLGSYAFHM